MTWVCMSLNLVQTEWRPKRVTLSFRRIVYACRYDVSAITPQLYKSESPLHLSRKTFRWSPFRAHRSDAVLTPVDYYAIQSRSINRCHGNPFTRTSDVTNAPAYTGWFQKVRPPCWNTYEKSPIGLCDFWQWLQEKIINKLEVVVVASAFEDM